METIRLIFAFCVIINNFKLYYSEDYVTINNPVKYPYGGPFVGFFLAIAIPLELDFPEVFFSFNFEANYNLPSNESIYEYPPDISRAFSISRKYAYDALEFKFKSHGYPGRSCLLRTICEASEYSFQHNGVLADILHIILTPSTSKTEELIEHEEAEKYGKTKKNCKKYERKCSVSIVGLISWLGGTM